MCFTIFQKEKNAFLEYKTRSSNSWKIGIFPKGLINGFVQKLANLHLFILGKTGKENVFHDILQRTNAFIDYKNKKFRESKNWDFSTPWFWSKIGNFPILLFYPK